MLTQELHYPLPRELIAQEPARPRDRARLLVLYRNTEKIEEDLFLNLPRYLNPGDLLVYNDTEVLKARLFAKKETGGKVEILVVKIQDPHHALALIKSRRSLSLPLKVYIGKTAIEVLEKTENGYKLFSSVPLFSLLKKKGVLPLPPYIKSPLKQATDYQTIFAKKQGSVAAPTAALHFTPRLIKKCKKAQISFAPLTLHIGLDTFLPIKTEKVEDHPIHTEYYFIPSSTRKLLTQAQKEKRAIVAIGTTVVRALESFAWTKKSQDFTNLFILPGYSFQSVDKLITNFHFPCSPLLALVMSFGGKELIKKAYAYALEKRFRFLSFGDAMLIL